MLWYLLNLSIILVEKNQILLIQYVFSLLFYANCTKRHSFSELFDVSFLLFSVNSPLAGLPGVFVL
mgnify:CR=1 FL=1